MSYARLSDIEGGRAVNGSPNGIRLAIIVAAASVFALITHDVLTNGWLSTQDAGLSAWLRAHGNAPLHALMTWASRSGGPAITSAYAAAVIVVYLLRRRAAGALAIAIIVYGGALLNVAMKHFAQRPRPIPEAPITMLPTYSFPSGHAAASTVFGGLICLVVWHSEFRGLRIATLAGVVTWVASVGFSRIYLGFHYPTDVVAGTAEGILWLMVSTIALERLGLDLGWHPAHSKAST